MEGYLARQPLGNMDPMQCAFVWGPRAKEETSKMRVLEFVAKFHGSDPTAFPSQYEEAVLEEEERHLGMIFQHVGLSSACSESSTGVSSFSCHI